MGKKCKKKYFFLSTRRLIYLLIKWFAIDFIFKSYFVDFQNFRFVDSDNITNKY